MMKDFLNGISLLPQDIKNILIKTPENIAKKTKEIRFRKGEPVIFETSDGCFYITNKGRPTRFFSDDLIITDDKDLQNIVFMLSRRSIHTYQEMIAKGFIPLQGGCKAGVVGRAVVKNGSIYSVSSFNSVNIRISREFKDCSNELLRAVGDCSSYIIIGSPMSGKTTLLRDICRKYSKENNIFHKKIAIIDERDEIASKYFGDSIDVGIHTDVLTLYPKSVGTEIAVRTLSPDVIILDEIGGEDEVRPLLSGVNSGVDFIATAHGTSVAEVLKRPNIKKIVSSGVFKKAVVLEGKNAPCKVKEVISL